MRLPLPLAFLVSGFTVDVEKNVLNGWYAHMIIKTSIPTE